tara:strand:- start:42 stop:506 length:465 start_codon:yes stop_codon:yes gene_type:complete
MFATHYHELTALSDENQGVSNFSVAVRQDGERIVFLRQLVQGAANRSYGIQVAGLAGLPGSVQERAKAILTSLEAARGKNAPTKSKNDHSNSAAQKIAQLSLFGGPPAQPKEHRTETPARLNNLVKYLEELKIEELTPIKALVELDQLKRIYKG